MEQPETGKSTCMVTEENIVVFSGSTVHVHTEDGKGPINGIEVARGDSFSIVRLSLQQMNECEEITFSIIAKVGENLRWPVAKNVFVVKIDKLRYLFSVVVPAAEEGDTDNLSEILNYEVSFEEEEDSSSSMELLDECLQKYASFSTDPSTVLSKVKEESESYNSVVARTISEGSQKIVNGLHFCSSAYSSLLHKQAETLRRDITSQPRLTVGSEIEKSLEYLSDALQRSKELTKKTDEWSEKALKGLLSANVALGNWVIQSKAGNFFFGTLPGETLLASMDGVAQIIGGVQNLGMDVVSSTSELASGIVASRFGEDAGKVTGDVLIVVGHALRTVWNVTSIAKIINPAKSATTSGVKKSLKASAKKRVKKFK